MQPIRTGSERGPLHERRHREPDRPERYGDRSGRRFFFFAVSGPGSSSALGIDGVERAFWAAADVMTILAMLQGRGRIGDLALSNPSLLAWPVWR